MLEKEGSPLDILQKHKRDRIERKELGDSMMQESSNDISALGDTFRQTIFNPTHPSVTTQINRSSEVHKQIPLPNSSGTKSSVTSNGFDGSSYQNLLNKLIPAQTQLQQQSTFDNRRSGSKAEAPTQL